MDWKSRKKPLIGLVGGIGVVVLLGSLLAGWYPFMSALVAALAIWIVGTMLVHTLIP